MAGNANDEQFTPDELALMRGDAAPADSRPEPDAEAIADAAVADADAAAPAEDQVAPAEDAPSLSSNDSETSGDGFIPKFDATAPEGYDEQKKAIRDEKQALRSKWSNGELSDEEWAQQEAALDDRYEALRDEYLTAQALKKANEQIQAQQQQETLLKIAADAKKVGIDYSDPGIGSLYDNRLSMVASEDAFKGQPFDVIAREANRRVLELFGKTTAPQQEQPKPKGAPNRPQLPPTLANMPAAAAQPVGSDLSDQLDAIDDPDILEAKWASLPASQRSSMLRSTLPSRR